MRQRQFGSAFLSAFAATLIVVATARAGSIPSLKDSDLGMRANQRLSYLAAAATVGAAGINLVPDANGRWVDVRTGHSYAEGTGSGGAGVSLFDVYQFGTQTILQRSDFLINTAVNAITASGSGVITGNDSVVDILWAKPANFAAYHDQDTANLRVKRLTYTLDGRAFTAIRIQANTSNGWTQSTYDLKTGLLIIQSYATHNTSTNSTGLAIFRITGGKRVTLPGMGVSWPTDLKKTKGYTFSLKTSDTVSGSGTINSSATVTWSSLVWSSHLLKLNVATNGHSAGTIQYIAGETDGPWMSPAALKSMKKNQVLDAESALQYTVTVTSVSGTSVSITFKNKVSTVVYTYKVSTGDLQSVVSHLTEGLHSQTQTLTLTKKT